MTRADWVNNLRAGPLLAREEAASGTTHGANDNFKGVATLFGIGAVNGTAPARVILTILLAWVTTLTIAAALVAGVYLLLRAFAFGG